MSKTNIENRKTQNIVGQIFKWVTIVSFLGCGVTIGYTLYTTEDKRHELEELTQKAEQIQAENDEYQRLLDDEDVNTYMETLAIENMSYAYPNEIRFFDTSRN